MQNKKVDGFNWILDVDDGGIGRVLASKNTSGEGFSFAREKLFMNLLVKTIKQNMTCIDLGCNIGYATMFMLKGVGNNGQVYAIEPDQHNLDIFLKNVEINGFNKSFLETIKCAISDYDGQTSFWIASQPNLNSINKTKHSTREEKIDCFSLKTFCSNRKYPNFIKMDIEGHEVKVLEGGYEYFKQNKGETHFLIEVHPKEYNEKNNFSEILYKYETIGFKIKTLISTPTSNPIPFLRFGYKPHIEIEDDGWIRGIYENLDNKHAIDICSNLHNDVYGQKAVRAILLSREKDDF